MPKHWDSETGPRPIVFIHGLGLGLLQYHRTIAHLFTTFSDRPILILLQPQISQNIFHPKYLQPMTRHQTADRLSQLLIKLGWANADMNDAADSSEEEKQNAPLISKKRKGVTMLSHSKYEFFFGLSWFHAKNDVFQVDHIPTHGYSKVIQRWLCALVSSILLHFALGKEVRISVPVYSSDFILLIADVCYNFIYRSCRTVSFSGCRDEYFPDFDM